VLRLARDKNLTLYKTCNLFQDNHKCEIYCSIYSNTLLRYPCLCYFYFYFIITSSKRMFLVDIYLCVVLYTIISSVIAGNRKAGCLWVILKQVGRARSRRQVADANIQHIRSMSHASCSICSGYPIRDACTHATAWLTQWFSESLRPSWNPARDFCRSLGPVVTEEEPLARNLRPTSIRSWDSHVEINGARQISIVSQSSVRSEINEWIERYDRPMFWWISWQRNRDSK